jgi:molybdopterin-containing oxidoreductase family iron-sulfur binding subunit
VAPGLFGSRSDRRIALAPAQVDALVQRVAARLMGGAPAAAGEDAELAAFENVVVQALHDAGPGALLFAGPSLSPASHAALHALHQHLGAIGRTVDLLPPLAMGSDTGRLPELVQAMRGGSVETLLVLDANPAYDTPAPLGFADALQRVRFSVHAGLYRDETARACSWHLPLSHAFEQWGDARAHDGTVTLLQPAIAPLYDTRSLHEIVALLAGEEERDGWKIMQQAWRTTWGAAFDANWRASLQRGFVENSAASPLSLAAKPVAPAPAAAPAAGLLAVFTADPSVQDGRWSNSAWLQELPRPFTKYTWDNAVLLGPRTAAAAGLQVGDRVRVRTESGVVEGPVWVEGLQAEGVAVLPLGYGRRDAGRVGNAVGFDAYRLMPPAGMAIPATLEKLGGEPYNFGLEQRTQDPSERAPVRVVSPGERASEHAEPLPSLYPEVNYPEHAWAMVVDLDACIGCNACTIACQAENNIPVVGREQVAMGRIMHWIRVDRYDTTDASHTNWQPVPCMQCEKAPCELVCPVGATMHDSEGLNVQVYNRCVGTRFCSNNCPYKVRRFNFLQYSDQETESLKGQRNPEVTVRDRGVMEKCNYCLQRIARARQHSQVTGVPLADGDVVTACQAVCPTNAIHFGDLRNPHSEVLRLRQSPRHYVLLEDLDTQPLSTYLAKMRARET